MVVCYFLVALLTATARIKSVNGGERGRTITNGISYTYFFG